MPGLLRKRTAAWALLLALVVSENVNAVSGQGPCAAWTVLLYVAGDHPRAAPEMLHAVDACALVGSTQRVRVVALADQAGGLEVVHRKWPGARFLEVERDRTVVLGEHPGYAPDQSPGMDDGRVLADLLSVGLRRAPAHRVCLLTVGHGLCWQGLCTDRVRAGVGYEVRPLALSALARGISSGLGAVGRKRVDVLGLVNCCVGCLEVAEAVDQRARFVVSSEGLTCTDAIDLPGLLAFLNRNPSCTGEELARWMVDHYRKSMECGCAENVLDLQSVATYDMACVPPFLGGMRHLADVIEKALRGGDGAVRRKLWAARAGACTTNRNLPGDIECDACSSSRQPENCSVRDVGTWLQRAGGIAEGGIGEAAHEAMLAFDAVMRDKSICPMDCVGCTAQRLSGMSMYFPCDACALMDHDAHGFTAPSGLDVLVRAMYPDGCPSEADSHLVLGPVSCEPTPLGLHFRLPSLAGDTCTAEVLIDDGGSQELRLPMRLTGTAGGQEFVADWDRRRAELWLGTGRLQLPLASPSVLVEGTTGGSVLIEWAPPGGSFMPMDAYFSWTTGPQAGPGRLVYLTPPEDSPGGTAVIHPRVGDRLRITVADLEAPPGVPPPGSGVPLRTDSGTVITLPAPIQWRTVTPARPYKARARVRDEIGVFLTTPEIALP